MNVAITLSETKYFLVIPEKNMQISRVKDAWKPF